jgi:divalent metal cation (Fe/Co/Zn/Cd) transporter
VEGGVIDVKRASDVDAARRRGRVLEWATIGWNSGEVFVTVGLGLAANSLALVAFGLDSLVEVFASVVVLWHLRAPTEHGQTRRRRALRLVATAFTVLAVYLLVAATRSFVSASRPENSPLGIAYLALTAVAMFSLARVKKRVGQKGDNDPLLAEASMTFLDGCLSVGILTALVVNALWGWWWADPLAAAVVAVFCLNEARESWREST